MSRNNNFPTYEEVVKGQYLNGTKLTVYNYGLTGTNWSICQEGKKEPAFKYCSVSDHTSYKVTTNKGETIASIELRTIKNEPPYYAVEYTLPNSPQSHFTVSFHLESTPYMELHNVEGELIRYTLVEGRPSRITTILDSSKNPSVSFKYSLAPFKVGKIQFMTNVNDSVGSIVLHFLTSYLYIRHSTMYKEKSDPKICQALDNVYIGYNPVIYHT